MRWNVNCSKLTTAINYIFDLKGVGWGWWWELSFNLPKVADEMLKIPHQKSLFKACLEFRSNVILNETESAVSISDNSLPGEQFESLFSSASKLLNSYSQRRIQHYEKWKLFVASPSQSTSNALEKCASLIKLFMEMQNHKGSEPRTAGAWNSAHFLNEFNTNESPRLAIHSMPCETIHDALLLAHSILQF